MAKIVCKQMPVARDLPQKNPPGGKNKDPKAPEWDKFLGVCGWLSQKLIAALASLHSPVWHSL